MHATKAPPRTYVSPVRTAAAGKKRQAVIAAATRLLREDGITSFSLDAIAKLAGVTRLTVYNQFGSRGGVLEAVLDDLATRGELNRLADVIEDRDPWRSLDLLVEVICGFWSFDPAVGRLDDAMVLDREFAQAVHDRTERRRSIIRSIVRRLHPRQSAGRERDMVDLIFSLTAHATFNSLGEGRTPSAVCSLLQRACRSAADRLGDAAGE